MGTNYSIDAFNHLVLFDGVCIFCNTSIDFILENEKNHDLVFAPLQSDLAKQLLIYHRYPINYMESILFFENGKLLAKSDAAVALAKYLKQPYSWLRIFKFVPRPIRNLFYNLIANNRYSIFGKYDACMVPSPEVRSRFYE